MAAGGYLAIVFPDWDGGGGGSGFFSGTGYQSETQRRIITPSSSIKTHIPSMLRSSALILPSAPFLKLVVWVS